MFYLFIVYFSNTNKEQNFFPYGNGNRDELESTPGAAPGAGPSFALSPAHENNVLMGVMVSLAGKRNLISRLVYCHETRTAVRIIIPPRRILELDVPPLSDNI